MRNVMITQCIGLLLELFATAILVECKRSHVGQVCQEKDDQLQKFVDSFCFYPFD